MKEQYHFIGIGGIGMSALAHILLEKQMSVTGSDLSLTYVSEDLQSRGAVVYQHHEAKNIQSNARVIYNSEIHEENPEIVAARELACPLMHRSELLAELLTGNKALAVTGTHGKTTTSSLLASILLHAKRDISFAIGGYLQEFGVNGRFGRDELFVLEADESDSSFLRYHPTGAIITNIEEEHMNFFGTEEKLHNAFKQFIEQVQDRELLLYCGDDLVLKRLVDKRGYSYGFSEGCDYHITNFRQEGWHLLFDLHFRGKCYANIEVARTGRHNALNAASCFALCMRLGLSEDIIRLGLKTFRGVKRRSEKTFEDERVLLIDDYGHHPTEIKTTLRAIKEAIGARRLVVIFQPHRYTRTARHFEEFIHAFTWADHLFVTEIYPAFEKPIEGITTENLICRMKEVSSVPIEKLSLSQGIEKLSSFLHATDVVLTIGAGSITKFNHMLADHFATASVRKLQVGLVFGGASCEHAISRRSAAFVAASLNSSCYDLYYFGIDKQGRWQIGERAKEMLECADEISFEDRNLFCSDEMRKEIDKIDLFFPVLHGPNGEDGTLQGFFEILRKPYAGPDHRSAAVGMDKAMTKRAIASAGVPTPPFISISEKQWRADPQNWLQEISSHLRYPLYVKPIHLGSSVGIRKVHTSKELEEAIPFAFLYDREILIEESIEGGRELEFAVLGDQVAHPGEKLSGGNFVDYQMKYGENPVKTSVVAEISEELSAKGRELALKAYHALGGSAMMRVDFILDKQGTFWCFEVNPIPGMQKFSLYPKIWERRGVSNRQLFDTLITLALERNRNAQKMV